jgi:hypothetical protein
MKCPNCGVEAPAGAPECAGCGVIFAKFMKKLDLKAPVQEAGTPWKGRALAFSLLVLWFIGLSLYYQRRVAEMRVANPAGPARKR